MSEKFNTPEDESYDGADSLAPESDSTIDALGYIHETLSSEKFKKYIEDDWQTRQQYLELHKVIIDPSDVPPEAKLLFPEPGMYDKVLISLYRNRDIEAPDAEDNVWQLNLRIFEGSIERTLELSSDRTSVVQQDANGNFISAAISIKEDKILGLNTPQELGDKKSQPFEHYKKVWLRVIFQLLKYMLDKSSKNHQKIKSISNPAALIDQYIDGVAKHSGSYETMVSTRAIANARNQAIKLTQYTLASSYLNDKQFKTQIDVSEQTKYGKLVSEGHYSDIPVLVNYRYSTGDLYGSDNIQLSRMAFENTGIENLDTLLAITDDPDYGEEIDLTNDHATRVHFVDLAEQNLGRLDLLD